MESGLRPGLSSGELQLNQRIAAKWIVLGGPVYMHAPGEVIPATVNQVLAPDITNQIRVEFIYSNLNSRGFRSAEAMVYDVKNGYLQGATVQSAYNWDCCGVTFEYSRWALGPVRNENAYRFAFSLANVGTFRNLRRLQTIY